jgi:hypothetical protein
MSPILYIDRLHHRKLSKPVKELHPFGGQGFLHPEGMLKFSIGLEMDFLRFIITCYKTPRQW